MALSKETIISGIQLDNNVATHATYSGDNFTIGGIYTTDQ